LRFHLDEARTLRGFWSQLRGAHERRDIVVGHNVYEFGLSFLWKRSVIQRVRRSARLSFARYRSRPVFDTMKEWELWAGFYPDDHLIREAGIEAAESPS
jgi:hypothetical protein